VNRGKNVYRVRLITTVTDYNWHRVRANSEEEAIEATKEEFLKEWTESIKFIVEV
jgi:hypothetical protein